MPETILKAEKQSQATVSLIIPTYNGAKTLGDLLTMLGQQSLQPHEIIIIDSSSKDGTRDIASKFGVRVELIEEQDFEHGKTRTAAGKMARGDILVYMTQDAIPADKKALERLIRPLQEDDQVAASYGRQLPSLDANIFSEHLRLFNYPPESHKRCFEDRQTYGFKTIFISNSFAAYKKSILAENDYFPDKLIFGEDTCTVAKLMENDYCVAYVSDACVYHSHNYSVWQDFRRYFDIGVFHVTQPQMLERFGKPTGAGKKFVLSELTLLRKRKKFYLIPESFMRNIAKFTAYNLGRKYKLLPSGVAVFCSMQRNWWAKI